MKNLDGQTTTHRKPGQTWGKRQQGSSKSSGHTDLGQEAWETPTKSQGALQVGIVQLFLSGFRYGAGISGSSSAIKSHKQSESPELLHVGSTAAPRAAPKAGQPSLGMPPAMPAPFQTLLSGNTKLKGVRTKSRKENGLYNFR